MKLPRTERVVPSIGIFVLVAILVALAILQYRWSHDVSQATGDRMRASLQFSILRFREDLSHEFSGLAAALQAHQPPQGALLDASEYTERIEAWKRTAAHPDLFENLYILKQDGSNRRLLRLDLGEHRFEEISWPARIAQLRDPLNAFSSDIVFFDARRNDKLEPGGPRPFGPFGGPILPWRIDESSLVLLYSDVQHGRGETSGPRAEEQARASGVNWIIVELNRNVVQEQILPQLAQTYFSGAEGFVYDVAVINRNDDDMVLYSSNPSFGMNSMPSSDAALNLFGPAIAGPASGVIGGGPVRGEFARGGRAWRMGYAGLVRLEPFRLADRGPSWELMVKHRKGSLEAALASMHHRQLAISFGVLILLAATMAMIIVATRRAQRLAKLQMDFVTGVSHELRTPLAVIGSAAENIADGIVQDKGKVAQYGKMICKQTQQLSSLVEQILLFAATRQDRYQYNFSCVQPLEIVALALENSAELIRAAGFTVEKEITEDLPLVRVDVPAVSQCLQNLIANAVKYGGDGRWIGIQVTQTTDREVRITVEDRGIGIASGDLPRIFDPFYRSPAVASAQIHGTGLGLALAKGIAEAMGGRLSVRSELGKGSCFTLYLPFADEAASDSDEQRAAIPDDSVSNIQYEPERFNR